MKHLLCCCFLLNASVTFAQPKIITQAIVTTKTTITTPEGEDEPASQTMQSANGEEVRIMRFGGDGETKSTTYYKNDLVKTVINNEMGRTTTIRDNANKKTTTLMEIMGKKTGFYSTDEEQEQMRKQMDSLMQTKRQHEAGEQSNNIKVAINSDIVYMDESKKIAGFICKKALIITTKNNGKDTLQVWYNPEIKLQGLVTTGGTSGLGGFMRNNNSNNSLAKINGFVMEYETKLNKGKVMKVEVTKLETEKQVTDKEFEIPKDYELKPMKDMQSGGRGFQMRIGG